MYTRIPEWAPRALDICNPVCRYLIALAWGFFFVVNTNAGVMLCVFWLYGLATLATAFAFGSVIQRVRIANLFSLACVICVCISRVGRHSAYAFRLLVRVTNLFLLACVARADPRMHFAYGPPFGVFISCVGPH